MKVLELKKRPLDFKEYIKRSAQETDFETLIEEPCILTENGEIKVVYDVLGSDPQEMIQALRSIKYHVGKRSRGLLSTSRIFGFRPRLALRADYCSSTSMAVEFPKEHQIVCEYAKGIEDIYFKTIPEKYKAHKELSDQKLKGEWRIEGSVFTSGIINKNNPLKYHFDTGNFNDVFSAMVVFPHEIRGGHLALPEYNVGFKFKTNSLFMFDGQGILHGVTPIRKLTSSSYRYSVVYYSLKQIWKCLTINEELARIRNVKTTREKIRQNMPLEHRKSLEARFGKQ